MICKPMLRQFCAVFLAACLVIWTTEAFATKSLASVPTSRFAAPKKFGLSVLTQANGNRYTIGKQCQHSSQIIPPQFQQTLTALFQHQTPDSIPENNQHHCFSEKTPQFSRWKRQISSIHTSCRRWTRGLLSSRISARKLLARNFAIVLLCLATIFSSFGSDAWAVTGGRMGGSFSRSSSGRCYSPPRSYSSPGLRAPPSRLYYRTPRPIIVSSHHQHHHSTVYGPSLMPRREFGVSDMVVVTGAGLAIAYGVKTALEQEQRRNSGVLGPGVSVARLTVALSVPKADAPNSILSILRDLAQTARTDTREGVQRLIAQVALELLRQERSIQSAEARSHHYRIESEAERQYLRASVQQRSKFEKETVNNFGSKDQSSTSDGSGVAEDLSKATEAVVTILVSIEGDSTQFPEIKSRRDLREALSQLASDVQVDDCLLAGEVLWAPEERGDRLSQDDIFVDYPSLFPL